LREEISILRMYHSLCEILARSCDMVYMACQSMEKKLFG